MFFFRDFLVDIFPRFFGTDFLQICFERVFSSEIFAGISLQRVCGADFTADFVW